MIEERIRQALDTEAGQVVPHDHAKADNRRRLARARRRRRLAIPLISAVATATAATALVPIGARFLPGDEAQGPASTGASSAMPSTGPSAGPSIASMTPSEPLTSGVPLFTYRPATGGTTTMHAFVEGRTGGFGSAESEASSLGTGPYFGGVRSIKDGLDAPWWFGFMSPRMTAVVAELNDGRKIPARIVDVHGQKVFVVQLTGVASNARMNATGRLVSYDASGRRLATWKI